MWNEPYLETCCRSALHRLVLSSTTGRPADPKDLPCLQRLRGMGLACVRENGRFFPTDAGITRHETEVMHRPATRGC